MCFYTGTLTSSPPGFIRIIYDDELNLVLNHIINKGVLVQ